MITRPTPHWIGQATERIRPIRLVQGADAVRAASSGGTMTQRFQTTARAIEAGQRQPDAQGQGEEVVAAVRVPGVAERITAVRSQGRPSTAQRVSPTLG